MTVVTQISTLADPDAFKAQRAEVWANNAGYWLTGPLRHVVDVGEYIADRTLALCRDAGHSLPVVVDMGCGDGWLLRALRRRAVPVRYIGLDFMEAFVSYGRREFADVSDATFEVVDFEQPSEQTFEADIVVNAFNFFELSELRGPFANAARFLRPGGTLHVSTIDKTYLLLAMSDGFEDFVERLKQYQNLPGTKYAFQRIDLGNAVAETMYYPSVLYTAEDYLDAAAEQGLTLTKYSEHAFTAQFVPKIYNHYEFRKSTD